VKRYFVASKSGQIHPEVKAALEAMVGEQPLTVVKCAVTESKSGSLIVCMPS
jgi:hypothetical protein